MGEVFRFKRQPNFGLGPRRRRLGSLSASWRPVVAVVCGTLIGYWMTEPITDQVRSIAGASSNFRICVRAKQQNCVIDGDTIRHGGLTIRLEDIDTPETHKPKCASEAALGRRATSRLLELLNDGPFEVVHTGGRDKDIYGRKLRVIMRDGRSVGHTLVAEGLARYWDGARRSWCG
ncbi:MAG: thermonuclease family protein [Hyphomicrobiales bacterium]|nr:thermonuclease family protein [Hyphomicrobiales bacterium]